MAKSLYERFWEKVDKSGKCWMWTASLDGRGYGQFGMGVGRMARAHRIAYELEVGPIPEGLDLDHLCRTHPCVNPEHLEPVTRRENLLRGIGVVARNAQKTHCKNGHEFNEANTYHRRDYNGRVCRACVRDRKRMERRAGDL